MNRSKSAAVSSPYAVSSKSTTPISVVTTMLMDSQYLGYVKKNFENLDLNKCISRLVYGCKLKKIAKKGSNKPLEAIFHILESDISKLAWSVTKKGPLISSIDLKTVSNISETPLFISKVFKKCDPSLLLSVQYMNGKELILFFDSVQVKREWWCGLQYFIEEAQKSTTKETVRTTQTLAKEFFDVADTDGTKALDKKEMQKFLKDLQLYVKKNEIELLWKTYDANKDNEIDSAEFERFITELFRKDELILVFKKYASAYVQGDYETPQMSLFDLVKFFQEEQKQTITIAEARKIHPSFETVFAMKPCITFDFFGCLMFSMKNTIINPVNSFVHQDMSQPLTDYYISSSHNTYLMSNQLTGESSVLAYINALNKGCRCVELDIWTGPNSTPIIYHGHTMTTKIWFEDVIKVINEHAFVASPYPLILSFEMHADLKTQEKMLEILKRELGDQIYAVPENFEEVQYYPSPEELQGRILIKGAGKLKSKTFNEQPSQENCSSSESIKEARKESVMGNGDIEEDESDSVNSLNSFGNVSEMVGGRGAQSLAMTAYLTPAKKSPSKKKKTFNFEGENIEDSSASDDDSEPDSPFIAKIKFKSAANSKRPSQRVLGLSMNAFDIRKNNSHPVQKPLVTEPTTPLKNGQMQQRPEILQVMTSTGDHGLMLKSNGDAINTSRDVQNDAEYIKIKQFLELDDVIVSYTQGSNPTYPSILRKDMKERKTAYVVTDKDVEDRMLLLRNHHSGTGSVVSDDFMKKDRRTSRLLNQRGKAESGRVSSQLSVSDIADLKLPNLNKRESQQSAKTTASKKGFKGKKKEPKHKLLPELGVLYGMLGKHFSLSDDRKIWEISSLNESKIAKFYKTSHQDIINFHKKFLSRIYPLGSRIDSSNYDPITGWAAGSQIVALNFQKSDEPMLLNFAKFTGNGGIRSGYVLKPAYMRHDGLTNKLLTNYPENFKKPLKKLTVQVISGQQIRPDTFVVHQIIDPFIEVKIKGLEIDESANSVYRTHVVKDNGFHPQWGVSKDSCKFEFTIHAPDFCTLVLTAYHGEVMRKDKMGWYAIEFNNIQQGYRVVPLLNNLFQPIKNSYIFCKISIVDI